MIYPVTFEEKIGFSLVREKLIGLCSSVPAQEWVRTMEFSDNFNQIMSRLSPVAEIVPIISGDDPIPLDGLGNPAPALSVISIPGTFLPETELSTLRRSLGVFSDVAAFFARHRNEEGKSSIPTLDAIACRLNAFPRLCTAIDAVIDRYGNIADNASPQLATIRRSMLSMSGTVNSALRKVIAKAVSEGLVDSDTSPTVRDGRLVIPVPPMNKRRISGIVHDESSSGKTVFIEPAEVVEINNRIRELQLEERREIIRILTEIADKIRPEIDSILQSVEVVAHLDFVRAKGRYAIEVNANMPSVVDGPELDWFHACHPVLLLSLAKQGRRIVPLDIALTQKNRILVISGPNAGGKSVCLKTVGIIQYMLQCGLLPPVYENSRMGVFSDIFVDIGDDQSIEDDLSTYSSHLRSMKLFVTKGRPTSLFLIDEFGGGTEPQIGGAIAQAILHKFNEIGMWGVVTTHYQNLKHYAEETPGLINGSMLYDRHLMQPLFRLSIGNPGSSFAIEIARKTGLPQEIIAEAESIVGSDYVNLDKYLLDIARDRKYWDNKRQQIRIKEKKIEEVLEKYENEAENLRSKRREIIEDARSQAKKILDSSNAAIERTIKEIKEGQADKQRTADARRRLQSERMSLDKEADTSHPLIKKKTKKKKADSNIKASAGAVSSKPLAHGDNVKLDGQGTPGKILEIQGKNAIVVFGQLKTTVALDRLKHTDAQIKPNNDKSTFVSAVTSDAIRERQLNFSRELDVRGMRVDEAVQAVTYFIDDAVQFAADRVRILHGTGTGALRQAIRQYLESVPAVRSYKDEHVQFGGAGITVVNFE